MTENPIPSLESLLAHRRWVRGVARRLLRDEHAAEDLAQEAWVRAMRSPPDPERDPKPWLRRVLKNLASNVRRGEGRRQKRETAWRESREQRSPEALVAEAEQHKRLVNLLLDLEEPFKTALVLRFYEGLGPQEIAERLDVPVGTVHSRIARAIERIKTRLDEEENGNRRAWIAGLLPLAGLDRHARAAATTATTTSLTGILVMTLSKPKVALLTVLLVGCLVVGGVWLASDSSGDGSGANTLPDLLTSEAAPKLEGRGAAPIADAEADGRGSRGSPSGPAADAARVVRGTVRDAAGNPVSGAEVMALPVGAPGLDEDELAEPRYGRTHTTSDGTFEVRLAERGSARLLAFAEGHTAGSTLLDEALLGEPVELALGEPWRLCVRVADADGAWPADCEVELRDRALDVLDRAIDPRRQAFHVDLAAPGSGNERAVALHRTGSVWLFAMPPRGLAAVPRMTRLAQPTDEVTIRIVRSGELTVRLFDARADQPLGDDVDVHGWMGRRKQGDVAWSFWSRGPRHRWRTNIAPESYDLEFEVPGYEKWAGTITFGAEGETRTLDVRMEPLSRGVSAGRLLLRVTGGEVSSRALLEFARLRGEALSGPYEMFARMREGNRKAWNRIWGTSGGWAGIHMTAQEDGSIEVQQAVYPLQDAHMPAGTYDLYVAERGTGRAAFVPGVRVFGDQENRYDVRLEPGTMISLGDVLPGDTVFTGVEVRTAEAGSLPIVELRHAGMVTFDTARVPRVPPARSAQAAAPRTVSRRHRGGADRGREAPSPLADRARGRNDRWRTSGNEVGRCGLQGARPCRAVPCRGMERADEPAQVARARRVPSAPRVTDHESSPRGFAAPSPQEPEESRTGLVSSGTLPPVQSTTHSALEHSPVAGCGRCSTLPPGHGHGGGDPWEEERPWSRTGPRRSWRRALAERSPSSWPCARNSRWRGEVIPRIANGFAGGIGNTGSVCGAVIGAVMAIGLKLERGDTMEEMLRSVGGGAGVSSPLRGRDGRPSLPRADGGGSDHGGGDRSSS